MARLELLAAALVGLVALGVFIAVLLKGRRRDGDGDRPRKPRDPSRN